MIYIKIYHNISIIFTGKWSRNDAGYIRLSRLLSMDPALTKAFGNSSEFAGDGPELILYRNGD
jgi:hypothetical protein